MKQLKKIISVAAIILTYTKATAQSDDSLFYRHSVQLNVAGLGIERWAAAYEYRMSPKHALFFQGGGSFPYLSEEKEYGFGLHYRYFFKPVKNAKFLWLFKSAYKNSFADFNVRYMNLVDGIYKDAESTYEAFFVGAGIGQNWVWNSGFTIRYWVGYGPPLSGEYKWKNTVPDNGDQWAKTYKWASGLDFGLSFGYSFGNYNKR
ncbi:MAG: hypothetical protein QM534_18990 [Sediminibacterium sp.]|nr:hypothetical protein [Sediminibacterium sp.]